MNAVELLQLYETNKKLLKQILKTQDETIGSYLSKQGYDFNPLSGDFGMKLPKTNAMIYSNDFEKIVLLCKYFDVSLAYSYRSELSFHPDLRISHNRAKAEPHPFDPVDFETKKLLFLAQSILTFYSQIDSEYGPPDIKTDSFGFSYFKSRDYIIKMLPRKNVLTEDGKVLASYIVKIPIEELLTRKNEIWKQP